MNHYLSTQVLVIPYLEILLGEPGVNSQGLEFLKVMQQVCWLPFKTAEFAEQDLSVFTHLKLGHEYGKVRPVRLLHCSGDAHINRRASLFIDLIEIYGENF